MIVAGPIEGGSGWFVLFAVLGLALVAWCCLGGLVAVGFSGRSGAFVMGTTWCAVGAWSLRTRFGVDGEHALLMGLAVSAVAGALVFGASWSGARRSGRSAEQRGTASIVGLTLAAGAVVLIA
ncbi:MAG TPA: hypothetical protein VHK88_10215 [Aquihabitans sp.]|jgi:hypothetical protein|nr:hypothetical protein [Aquihabitans sp.]